MPRRPSEARKRDALLRFREQQDTAEDRQVLRACRIDSVTLVGGRLRSVPTAEEDAAATAKAEAAPQSGRPVPRVWKMGKGKPPPDPHLGDQEP